MAHTKNFWLRIMVVIVAAYFLGMLALGNLLSSDGAFLVYTLVFVTIIFYPALRFSRAPRWSKSA